MQMQKWTYVDLLLFVARSGGDLLLERQPESTSTGEGKWNVRQLMAVCESGTAPDTYMFFSCRDSPPLCALPWWWHLWVFGLFPWWVETCISALTGRDRKCLAKKKVMDVMQFCICKSLGPGSAAVRNLVGYYDDTHDVAQQGAAEPRLPPTKNCGLEPAI